MPLGEVVNTHVYELRDTDSILGQTTTQDLKIIVLPLQVQ